MKKGGRATLWQSVGKATEVLSIIAGVAVTFIMILTVLDVICRAIWVPILGSYEIITLTGAIIVGFSMPFATASGSHVCMEMLIDRLPRSAASVMSIATRIICALLFGIISVSVFRFGSELAKAHEVSWSVKIPIYPFVYAFSLCCLFQVLVFIAGIVRIVRSRREE